MNQTTATLEGILAEAVEIASPADRQVFVDKACAGNVDLRAQIERLMANHFRAGSFLERPAAVLETAALPAQAEAPGTQIGPYKLLEQIGEGGMGIVYVAEQQQPIRRTVALKIIKPGMDSKQVVARFEAERQALALMDHPNIAKVLDAGTTDVGRPFFVMELIRGIQIIDYCDQAQFTIRQRLEVFVQVCRAVQHAHTKGVIHRDLKPGNVLVTSHDGVPVPMVIDFGVAKALGQQLTERTLHTGFAQMIGTPLYMSPEQAEFNQQGVDTRSDIYSLGVLLYELLTGTTPFDGERLRTVGHDEFRRILREEEPPRPSARLSTLGAALSTASERRGVDPRKLTQTLHGELDWIVLKSLEKDRTRRYETASAFAADVQRYLNDEAVEACPPSAWYKLRKFARRRKVSLAVAACCLIAATAVAVTIGRSVAAESVRLGQVEGEVRLALRDAELLQEQQKWSEAAAAAKRAWGLLLAGPANAALQELVDQRVGDLMLAADLELIYTDRMVRLAERHWDTLSDPQIDTRYASAFQNAGIDVENLSVEAAAGMIRGRAIRPEIAAALDCWTAVRSHSTGKDDASWKQLQELATAVDPDPFRVQLRQAWAERGKDNRVVDVKKIFASPELLDQRMSLLNSFASGVFLVRGNNKGWRELLLAYHRRHPEDFWINFELGSDHESPPVDELRFATAAVALRPDNAGAHLSLSSALGRMGRFDEAIAECRDSIRLRPESGQEHHCLAAALKAKGLLDEASVEYREAIRLAPDEPDAHYDLGNILARQGKLKDAIPCFREAIRLKSWHADAHNDLGAALERQGQRDEAIVHYREAIRHNPRYAVAHCNLGAGRAAQEKFDEAIACYRNAIRLKPDYADAHNNLAWLLATCSDVKFRDPRQAVTHAKKAVELAREDAGNWNTLGVAQYRNGDWKAAVAALTKSVELSEGGDNSDFFFLAMAHWQLGAKKEALSSYRNGVEGMEQLKRNEATVLPLRAETEALLGVSTNDSKKPLK